MGDWRGGGAWRNIGRTEKHLCLLEASQQTGKGVHGYILVLSLLNICMLFGGNLFLVYLG